MKRQMTLIVQVEYDDETVGFYREHSVQNRIDNGSILSNRLKRMIRANPLGDRFEVVYLPVMLQ